MVMRWPLKILLPVTITHGPVPESPLVADQVQSGMVPNPLKISRLSEPLPPLMSPGSHSSTMSVVPALRSSTLAR